MRTMDIPYLVWVVATVIVMMLIRPANAKAEGNSMRWALGQIESNDNDKAIGRAGEVSRYQIKRDLWDAYSRSINFTNEAEAWRVAEQIIRTRSTIFRSIHGRMPNPFEIYVLWNAPSQAYYGPVSRTVADRAQRFANMCVYHERYIKK